MAGCISLLISHVELRVILLFISIHLIPLFRQSLKSGVSAVLTLLYSLLFRKRVPKAKPCTAPQLMLSKVSTCWKEPITTPNADAR